MIDPLVECSIYPASRRFHIRSVLDLIITTLHYVLSLNLFLAHRHMDDRHMDSIWWILYTRFSPLLQAHIGFILCEWEHKDVLKSITLSLLSCSIHQDALTVEVHVIVRNASPPFLWCLCPILPYHLLCFQDLSAYCSSLWPESNLFAVWNILERFTNASSWNVKWQDTSKIFLSFHKEQDTEFYLYVQHAFNM